MKLPTNLGTALSLTVVSMLGLVGCNGNKEYVHEDEAQCKMVKPGVVTTPNKMCVIMVEDPVNPATEPVVYKGVKYGLCCEGCRARWEKLSDSQKEANIAKAMAASN